MLDKTIRSSRTHPRRITRTAQTQPDFPATMLADNARRPTSRSQHPTTNVRGSLPPVPPPDPVPPRPSSVQRYRVIKELARGGMGAVLIAEDTEVRREVAMKVILKANPSPAEVARFIVEAQVTGQLEHPAIPPVHDLVVDVARPYFTMKLVRGESLKALLTKTKEEFQAGTDDAHLTLPLRKRLEIFVRICEAIAFAHSRRVLHRDLKPDNIMVGRFGEVQVMDWGLAKRMEAPDDDPLDIDDLESLAQESAVDVPLDAALRTREGAVSGTPAYMSPEQARGETRAIDTRTDIYSLGLVLHTMLSFTTAYRVPKRGTIVDLLRRVRTADVQSPTAAAARNRMTLHVPPELESIVSRATAADPRRRYEDVESLAEDVRAFLADRPVAAHEDSWRAALVKYVRRNPARTIAMGAAAALVLLVTAGTAAWAIDASARDAQAAAAAAEADAASAQADAAAAEAERQAAVAAAQAAEAETATARAEQAEAAAKEARIAQLYQEGRLDELERELGVAKLQYRRDAAIVEFMALMRYGEQIGVTPGEVFTRMDEDQLQRYISAFERLLAASEEAPEPLHTWKDLFYLGAIYIERNDPKGIPLLLQAVRDPDIHETGVADAYWSIGRYYLEVHQNYAEATRYVDMALAAKPDSGGAHAIKGAIAGYQNRWVEARRELEQAFALGHSTYDLRVVYAGTISATDGLAAAIPYYEDLIRTYPDRGWACVTLAYEFVYTGQNLDRARELLETATTRYLSPRNQEALAEVQRQLEQAGR